MKPKYINIIKYILVIIFAVLNIYSANEFAYSYAKNRYCKKLTYSESTFPLLFYLKDDVNIDDFIDEVDKQPLILGYVFPKSKLTSTVELKNKSFTKDTIVKCGKWAKENTYQIIEGEDFPSDYGDKLPVLVCGDEWDKAFVGDDFTIKLKKTDGTVYISEAYISGKIKKENMIKGVYTSLSNLIKDT